MGCTTAKVAIDCVRKISSMGCNYLDFLSFDELIEEEGRGLADGLGF
jgi:hypothetical protein